MFTAALSSPATVTEIGLTGTQTVAEWGTGATIIGLGATEGAGALLDETRSLTRFRPLESAAAKTELGSLRPMRAQEEGMLDTALGSAENIGPTEVGNFVPKSGLPELPDGYYYRMVGGQTQVVRNPGRAGDLPQMHLQSGQLMLGPSPGIVRSPATRNAFLRAIANNPNIPKNIRPYLQRGELPPGYTVYHKKSLFDGGADTIDNMVLQALDLHTNTHRFYRPGGQIPTVNPKLGTFQSN